VVAAAGLVVDRRAPARGRQARGPARAPLPVVARVVRRRVAVVPPRLVRRPGLLVSPLLLG
jgi:hypothetical protein